VCTANGGQQDDARFPHTSSFGVRSPGASRPGGGWPDPDVLQASHACKREAYVGQEDNEYEEIEFEKVEYEEIAQPQRGSS